MAIGAVNRGAVTAEFGLFNGDEPEQPDQWPMVERFGDSWSGRLTGRPVRGLELQGSWAHVHSPEHRPGAGPDQDKWSVSGRWEGPVGSPSGVRAGRVGPHLGGRRVLRVLHSFLAEGAWTDGPSPSLLSVRANRAAGGGARVAGFEPLRPHQENSILGITRWTIHTPAGPPSGPRSEPGGRGAARRGLLWAVAEVGGGLFDVVQTYGRDHFWSWTLGFRLDVRRRPIIGWDATARRWRLRCRTNIEVRNDCAQDVVGRVSSSRWWHWPLVATRASDRSTAAAATNRRVPQTHPNPQSRRLPLPMVSRSTSPAAATMSPSASPRTSGSTATTPTRAPGADSSVRAIREMRSRSGRSTPAARRPWSTR